MTSPFYAYIEDFQMMTVIVPLSYRDDPEMTFHIQKDDETIACDVKFHQKIGDERRFVCTFQGHVLLNETYCVMDDLGNDTVLRSGQIVRTRLFDDLFYYDGALGAIYTKDATTFRIWSPIAKSMNLLLGEKEAVIPMRYTNQGVYEVTVDKDLDGVMYSFSASVNELDTTFIDPYGVASTLNGEKSVVCDLSSAYQMKYERPTFSGLKTDAIIYEISVRDLTAMLDIKSRRTFKGVIEKGLKTKNGNPAGLDYLKSLGVTHLQILPMYDFEGINEEDPDEMYNWGYNPSQYNVPEGSYASNPKDPLSRINDLKEMIDTLHKEGFRVIMDVVYNHVYEPRTFPFKQIIPGYAFRVDDKGIMTNVSGCGNDLATERLMIRKFIIDSIKYWVETFKIDGFRFDLMGLIDVTTMNRIYQTLEGIDKTLIIYGEGWKMPTTLPDKKMAHMFNKNVLFTIGFFNDAFRETIKGATFNERGLGFISGGKLEPHDVQNVLLGSVLNHRFLYPSQSINYIECHDNYTVRDKLKKALPEEEVSVLDRIQELGTAVVLLSQGVPFIHMGQEFMRDKKGVENSYNHPDEVNQVNWGLVDTHEEAIMRFRWLIQFRKDEPLLRLSNAALIKKHANVSFTSAGSVLYHLFNETNDYLIIFKPKQILETFSFDEPYTLLFSLDTNEVKENPLDTYETNRIQCLIFKKVGT